MSAREMLQLFNKLDQILQEGLADTSPANVVPNQDYIFSLIDHVVEEPEKWSAVVSKLNDDSLWQENWRASNQNIKTAMERPHRIKFQNWLANRLQPASKALEAKSVYNAFDVLQSACEALIVYDAVTPPRFDARSEELMNMDPDQVRQRATHQSPTKDGEGRYRGNILETSPLIAPAVKFISSLRSERARKKDRSDDRATPQSDAIPAER